MADPSLSLIWSQHLRFTHQKLASFTGSYPSWYTPVSLLQHYHFIQIKNKEITVKEKKKQKQHMISPPYSRLLLKDKLPCLSPHILTLCPAFLTAWQFLGNWIKADKGTTPFEIAQGMTLWEYEDHNPAFNSLFKEAMASDSGMLNLAIRDCKPVFLGLGSLVDVEGGIGKVASIISKAFPQLKCTVLDLPHVVANLPDTENVKFIGGDMFHSNPPADALLLKLTLHAYSDEECLKILKKCREAIPSDGGKVTIIDTVINKEKEEHQVTEAKLFFDMLMMVVVTGRERSERDGEKLFLESGSEATRFYPYLV